MFANFDENGQFLTPFQKIISFCITFENSIYIVYSNLREATFMGKINFFVT